MKRTFKLENDNDLTFTEFEDRLLFLHSNCMSAQLVMDEIGVQVMRQNRNIKVGFHNRSSEAYHSFYFKLKEFFGLVDYFKLLGFPCDGMKPNSTFSDRPRAKTRIIYSSDLGAE